MDRDEPSQPVAYPTTQYIKPVVDGTTRAAERSAENALLQNGFLVARLSLHDQEQVYKSSLVGGYRERGAQGRGHHPFAAWCRSMRSKADRASWAVYSWSGSRQ